MTTSKRVVVDPITRIEGHLRIEVELDEKNQVKQAYSSGTAFRGIELIMRGRDPHDMGLIAQRICGVCTLMHYERSTEAVERAYDVIVPPNARLVRGLMWVSQMLQDHLVHFYQLHAMDWFDILSALKADPAKTVAVAEQYHPEPFNASAAHYKRVLERIAKFASTGQLGPFANAYWGHPRYKLSPEENLILVSHYLDNLAIQRLTAQMTAIFGAKNPHPQSLIVGGVTSVRDALNVGRINEYAELLAQVKDFTDRAYIPDMVMIGTRYKDEAMAGHGSGLRNYMSFGALPMNDARWEDRDNFLPKGIILNRDLKTVHDVDPMKIAEEVTHSWYTYEGNEGALHPLEGQTSPKFTGMAADGLLEVQGKYSWLKSPRYNGIPMEVGPLARFVVGYAAGHKGIRALMDDFTRQISVPFEFWYSTVGRTVARALETKLLNDKTPDLIADLIANIGRGDDRFFTPHQPKDGEGWSMAEVPRGSLSHWVRIKNGVVENFQAIVPSTWNAGPRDSKGQFGAYEASLKDQPIADPKMPLEIIRTVHSFDPCLSCAVHLLNPEGDEVSQFKVVI